MPCQLPRTEGVRPLVGVPVLGPGIRPTSVPAWALDCHDLAETHAMRRLRALATHLGSSAAAGAQAEHDSPAQSLTEVQKRQFLDHGYLIISSFLEGTRLQAVRDAVERRVEAEGDMGGWEGGHSGVARRLCNLAAKHELFAELAAEPIFLECAALAVGRADFILNAMNFHDPVPGQVARQHIHADRGFFPSCEGYFNVIVALDEMTEQNGYAQVMLSSRPSLPRSTRCLVCVMRVWPLKPRPARTELRV